MSDIEIITLTNKGYADYTRNCIRSLHKSGIETPMKCYCLDREAMDSLESEFCSPELLSDARYPHAEFSHWGTDRFREITREKFTAIHKSLLRHEFVLFTDGDIVFEDKEVFQFLVDTIGNMEMLIQNDSMEDDNHDNLCTGFMFIRSTENTIEFFSPERFDQLEKESGKVSRDDQAFFNNHKEKVDYGLLPLALFPNGLYFRSHHPLDHPYIIHFNWLVGHDKRKNMQAYEKWYL